MSNEFVQLLQVGDEMSISLLIFWAACLHVLDGSWWAMGWARRIVEDALGKLGEEWEDVLIWPRSVVNC